MVDTEPYWEGGSGSLEASSTLTIIRFQLNKVSKLSLYTLEERDYL
jgi:hypothetical protein